MDFQEEGHAQPLSVSEAARLVQRAYASFGQLTILGEISEIKPPNRSGHVYGTIKDEETTLSILIFRGVYSKVNLELHVGDTVKIEGEFSFYAAAGKTSFIVRNYSFYGEGYLRKQIEALQKKLSVEGLFDQVRKKAIPQFAERVIVVTSPTGAVIEDVRKTLARRNPLVKMGYVECAVQGEEAPQTIVNALAQADVAGADVILLVRGGGSLEDLMAFNNEAVVRAVASLSTPIITGVGHGPDTTLVDFAADLRADTPTAAAEQVAPTLPELKRALMANKQQIEVAHMRLLESLVFRLSSCETSLGSAMDRVLVEAKAALARLAEAPSLSRPDAWLRTKRDWLTLTEERLQQAMFDTLERKRVAVNMQASTLRALSPTKVLERGYAFVQAAKGVVCSAKSVKTGEEIEVVFADGLVAAEVTDVRKETV